MFIVLALYETLYSGGFTAFVFQSSFSKKFTAANGVNNLNENKMHAQPFLLYRHTQVSVSVKLILPDHF